MIPKGHKTNLETIIAAAQNGELALVECTDEATGEPVHVVCGISQVNQEYSITPLAKMFDGNPYDELLPPQPLVGEMH